MKRKFFLILIFCVFIFLPFRFFFQTGFPVTHDGQNHLFRIANYRIALRQGQFPPRFAPNLLNGYGYPVFNYNYPLANILSIPMSVLKVHPEIILKTLILFFLVIGILGVLKLTKTLEFSFDASVFSISLFALSPFLFSTIVYRGNIGELMAFSLLPWIFELVVKFGQKRSLTFTSVLIGFCFFLSHNLTVVFTMPLLFLFGVIVYRSNKQSWRKFLHWLLVCTGLTLWFWLPAILEQSAVVVRNATLVDEFSLHFLSLSQIFFSPITFGFSFPGFVDSLSLQLGFPLIIVFFLATFHFFHLGRIRSENRLKLFPLVFLFMSFLSALLTLSYSKLFWELFSFLKILQFPWRLQLFSTFFIVMIGGYVWGYLQRSTKLFLILTLVFQTLILVRQQPIGYFHEEKGFYDFSGQSSSTQNENVSKAFRYTDIADWKPEPSVLSGQAEISVQTWNGTYRRYEVSTQEIISIAEPTMNFLGWETFITSDTDQYQKASYLDSEEIKGRIAFKLNPGRYTIESRFTQKTFARSIGNATTLLTMMYLAFLLKEKKLQW